MAASQKLVGGIAALLVAAVLVGSSTANAKTPEVKPKPDAKPKPEVNDVVRDDAAEAAACDWVSKNKPAVHEGRTRVEGQPQTQWLTFVAYWRAYPKANPEPKLPGELAAFARLVVCVAKKSVPPLNAPEKKADPKVPPKDLDADPLAEGASCDFVVANRPIVWLERKRGDGQAELEWLALVAYWRSYPTATVKPTTPNEVAAFSRLVACVNAKLPPEVKQPGKTVTDKPTPGFYYKIKKGDVLLSVSAAAYGTKPGTQPNYAAAKAINNDAYNQRFVRASAADNLFPLPKGRITFMPHFGSFEAQQLDAVTGAEVGPGGTYSTIYIPKL